MKALLKALLRRAAILALAAPVLFAAVYAAAVYVSVEYGVPMDEALKLIAGGAVLLGCLGWDQWRKFGGS